MTISTLFANMSSIFVGLMAVNWLIMLLGTVVLASGLLLMKYRSGSNIGPLNLIEGNHSLSKIKPGILNDKSTF